jgi:membrane protease subunit HflK
MSLNDPQWGKRGNNNSGGPPDLDEIWRNVNRRMGDLLGRRGGGDAGGGPPRRGLAIGGAGLILALVLLVWLASGFYIVDEGRRGVVTRFGKYTETTQPGPRWHLPFPVEAVDIVDFKQVRTVEIGYRNSPSNRNAKEATMLTEDENIIDIQFAVQYDLVSAESFVFNNRKPEDMVKFVAEAAIREVVGRSKMDFALYEGREQIATQTREQMQKLMDLYRTGVNIQKVTLQSVQPPEKVQAAFDDAVKAQQDRVRLVNEGQAYANDVVPRARGLASRLLEEANGYNTEVTQRSEGDASRFPLDSHRICEGPRGHARPPLPRHDAVGARQLEQDHRRPEGQRQPALPPARQADAADRHTAGLRRAANTPLVPARGAGAGGPGRAATQPRRPA